MYMRPRPRASALGPGRPAGAGQGPRYIYIYIYIYIYRERERINIYLTREKTKVGNRPKMEFKIRFRPKTSEEKELLDESAAFDTDFFRRYRLAGRVRPERGKK